MKLDLIGKWAFIVGIIVAVLAAFITSVSPTITILILFILGLIVGLLNVKKKNNTEFLIGAITLLIVGSLTALSVGKLSIPIKYLQEILNNFRAFVAAAALVVSIKTVVLTAKK